MKLKCVKNLVVGESIIIMKNDIIKIFGNEHDNTMKYRMYDVVVVKSLMCEDMEAYLDIHQIAAHFEYDN